MTKLPPTEWSKLALSTLQESFHTFEWLCPLCYASSGANSWDAARVEFNPAGALCPQCGRITYNEWHRLTMSNDNSPIQTHGDGKPRRSRSKGQQIIDVMNLVNAQVHAFATYANANKNDVDVASVAEVIRLADRLRELIRIPR